MVIGLDCATPQLIFDRYKAYLPNITGLAARGIWGELQSTIPPITVPAWTSMMSSKDPGTLGIYGFRNRKNYTYEDMTFANNTAVRDQRVWEILSGRGKKVILVGVPQTYPARPVNGWCVTCFLTPNTKTQYTYPAEFRTEVEKVVGDYILDVKEFRSEDRDSIIRQIYDMTEKRFKLARHMVETKPWDFFMMVEMGIDRMHHSLWSFCDPTHPKYVPGNKYENALADYYRAVDGMVGDLMQRAPEGTDIYIVSDHGAKSMQGGICLNEWLIREGYLTLVARPDKPAPLEKVNVDWTRTKAWGSGGYYGRLFLNVKGREPQGVIEPGDYEKVRDEIVRRIVEIPDPECRAIGTRAMKPQDVYPKCNGIPPDLILYFGNLDWRAVGSIGPENPGPIYTFENDQGPDDANHAERGIFILSGEGIPAGERRDDLKIMDVGPTILARLGVPIPKDMQGKVIAG